MTAHQPIGLRERKSARRVQALELRKAGATYRQIGQALACSAKTAFLDVSEALADLKAVEEDVATQVRAIELERLDALWQSTFPRAKAGDDTAVRSCLAIAKRRADLLGLDAPQKQEWSGPNGGPVVVRWGANGTEGA